MNLIRMRFRLAVRTPTEWQFKHSTWWACTFKCISSNGRAWFLPCLQLCSWLKLAYSLFIRVTAPSTFSRRLPCGPTARVMALMTLSRLSSNFWSSTVPNFYQKISIIRIGRPWFAMKCALHANSSLCLLSSMSRSVGPNVSLCAISRMEQKRIDTPGFKNGSPWSIMPRLISTPDKIGSQTSIAAPQTVNSLSICSL